MYILICSTNYSCCLRIAAMYSSSTLTTRVTRLHKSSVFPLIIFVSSSKLFDSQLVCISEPHLLHELFEHLKEFLHFGFIHTVVTWLPSGHSIIGTCFFKDDNKHLLRLYSSFGCYYSFRVLCRSTLMLSTLGASSVG